MRVVVVGSGYVGLVTAACLSEQGHEVSGVEIDERRLSSLKRGVVPFFEPGLDSIVDLSLAMGRLSFTSDLATVLPGADVVMIAVNTPPTSEGDVDLQFVRAAMLSIVACNPPPELVVALKSTVPVGTGDMLESLARAHGSQIQIVSNPEFLREGSAVGDFRHPDRIVVGGSDSEAVERVVELYATIDAPIVRVSRGAAELGKYAANAYLATRISYMNELARLTDAVRVDVAEIEQILGSDRRIGPQFLKAGIGWGGSCFPKDVLGLMASARNAGTSLEIVRAAHNVNVGQREIVLNRVLEALAADGVTRGGEVCVLGLAFKPNTDDIRESPALDVIRGLLAAGVTVRAHDPEAAANARVQVPMVQYHDDVYSAAAGADVTLIATDWPMYRGLDWSAVLLGMHGNVLVDARNMLNPAEMTSIGFAYSSLGQNVLAGTVASTEVRVAERPMVEATRAPEAAAATGL